MIVFNKHLLSPYYVSGTVFSATNSAFGFGRGVLARSLMKRLVWAFFLLPPYMGFCHMIQLLPLWALYRPGIVLLAPATKDVAQTAHRLFSILLHGPSSWLNIVNLCAPGRDGHF